MPGDCQRRLRDRWELAKLSQSQGQSGQQMSVAGPGAAGWRGARTRAALQELPAPA
jgi:hypothetical protein